jgi:hypothetical protein
MDFSPRIALRTPVSVNQKRSSMTTKLAIVASTTIACSLWTASIALAQDRPGPRAAGMGGAFVAVADDASAVYWNPAGLASEPLNLQIEFGQSERTPGNPLDIGAVGGRNSTRLLAFGVPPLGLSYYRQSSVRLVQESPAVSDTGDRQEGGLSAHRLTTNTFGVSVLQSVGGGIVLGSTLKLVQGSSATGVATGSSWNDVLKQGEDLDASGRTRADLDLGVMLNVGKVRLGLVGHNLREPNFAPDGVDDDSARLKREVRMGVAYGSMWPGLTPLIVSFDADLTKVLDVDGERRDVAVGAETWWLRRRLGVRGGWRTSTVGESRSTATGGLSVAVRTGVYIDAHIARGDDDRRAWSVGGRLTY